MVGSVRVAFDEFTSENGATRVIPGSHLWGADRQPKDSETIPMVCPAGSAVFFISTTWHCGGANKSTVPRKSATVQYCQPYVRLVHGLTWIPAPFSHLGDCLEGSQVNHNVQMLIQFYIQIRPIENQILAVDPRKIKDIPPRIVEMMGYRVHRPFIGYGMTDGVHRIPNINVPFSGGWLTWMLTILLADGLNPYKSVQRMVQWLQKPVNYSPPTFAKSSDLDSKLWAALLEMSAPQYIVSNCREIEIVIQTRNGGKSIWYMVDYIYVIYCCYWYLYWFLPSYCCI